MIIAILKLLFTMSFSVWIYEVIGIINITENFTEIDKLKIFVLKGHVLLFAFTYYVLYYIFFKFSRDVFSFLGLLTYWLFRLTIFFIANTVDLFASLLKLAFTFKWKFKFKSEINLDEGFFAFSYKIIKFLLFKLDLMTNPGQNVRASRELSLMIQLVRKTLVEEKELIYDKIHIVFVFSVLFYIFYFYYINYNSDLLPEVDFVVGLICISSAVIQLILYWLYKNFRVIYYSYLAFYRGLHNQDILRQKMEEYAQIQADQIQRNLQASLDNFVEDEDNHGE